MADPLKVLFMAAEMVPFAKTGGVSEVAGALPKALKALGHDVRVAMPRYSRIDPAKFALRPVLSNLAIPIDDHSEPINVLTTEVGDGLPVYFIDSEKHFGRENLYGYPDDGERFVFYSRGTMEMLKSLQWKPDVIHLNDWHTAIVANWLKTIYKEDPFFREAASVYTIHNLAYQGIFGWRILEIAGVEEYSFMYPHMDDLPNVVALMAHGILFADAISTVSETYAREILTPEYGEKLHTLLNDRKDRIHGILNGIDYEAMNPATDPYLPQQFDVNSLDGRVANKLAFQREAGLPVDEHIPLIGTISRLNSQKGFDILGEIIDALVELPLQLVIMGTGDQYYHEMLTRVAKRHPTKVAVFLTFNAALAQRIYGASDIFLMPSRFEPCGSSQMVAMRYGSVPVVRRTGGLADTVRDFDPRTGEGNGFAFDKYSGMMLFAAIVRALESYKYRDIWRRLMETGMRADNSWSATARKYEELYRKALLAKSEAETPVQVG
ncbi:MAG: glycogen synthase [Sphingomonadaceae bacterium]